MALGAFVAGLLLAETEFRKAIETTIEPFKGLLLGLFFFTVGMNIDFRELAREPLWLLASVVGLIGIKAILIIGLARLFRVPLPAAIETGLLLGPGGEFAFVVIGVATPLSLVTAVRRQLHAGRDLAHDGADPAACHARAAHRRTLEEPQAARPGAAGGAAAPTTRATPSSSATAGSGRSCATCWRRTACPSSPPTAIRRPSTEYRRRGREVYYGDADQSGVPEELRRDGRRRP